MTSRQGQGASLYRIDVTLLPSLARISHWLRWRSSLNGTLPRCRFRSCVCVAVGAHGPICQRRSAIPLFTSILPTTDAVIVLIQLAKDPGADRSVSEISVLPQDFEIDDSLNWPTVSRIARTRVQLLKRDEESCGRTTDITVTADASYTESLKT